MSILLQVFHWRVKLKYWILLWRATNISATEMCSLCIKFAFCHATRNKLKVWVWVSSLWKRHQHFPFSNEQKVSLYLNILISLPNKHCFLGLFFCSLLLLCLLLVYIYIYILYVYVSLILIAKSTHTHAHSPSIFGKCEIFNSSRESKK